MRNAFAAIALTGALALAPAAFAGEPTTSADPVTVEAQFAAPAARAVDEETLVAGHRAADVQEQRKAAGRMEGQDGWTVFAIGFLVVCAVIVAVV